MRLHLGGLSPAHLNSCTHPSMVQAAVQAAVVVVQVQEVVVLVL
jgi:hypothetical protein